MERWRSRSFLYLHQIGPFLQGSDKAMPALLGYMVAIVVTLGGYMVGLHWLLTPPDPFMPDPRSQRLATSHVKHETGKPKIRLTAVAPAAAAAESPPAPPSPSLASANDSTASAEAKPSPEDPPAAESARSEKHELSPPPANTTPPTSTAALTPPAAGNVPRAEAQRLGEAPSASRPGRNQENRAPARKRLAEGRQLQVMILRTYQSADGRRFTRLIPLREAAGNRTTRQIAFAPEFESSRFGF